MAGPLRNKNIVFLSISCAVMAAGAWHEGIISSKILKSSKGGEPSLAILLLNMPRIRNTILILGL